MNIQATQRVSLGEKIGYSMGDVAANLVFQMMMVYQLKFYTDVFGLNGAVAGTVLLFAPLASAFIDPLAGIIADRTHTRWGKYRPWIIWTALPFCLFYVMAFYNPGIEDKTMVAVYATISYVLLLTMYGFNNTPYSSLGGVMTSDVKERTSINKVRFVATSVAQLVVQGMTLPLVDRFSAGHQPDHGWLCTISLFASCAFILFVISFLSTKERIASPPQQKMSIRQDISETFSNVPWRALFVLTFILFITLSMWSSSMNFYFQSYINQDSLCTFLGMIGLEVTPETAYSTGFSLFNTTNAIVQFLGVLFLSSFLADRYGKKTVFVVGLSLTALFTLLFYLPTPDDVMSIYGLCILKSLAYAPTVPLLWAMVADCADYTEFVHHRRATGFCFSGIIFSLKAGTGLGAATAGFLLSIFGYVSGGMAVQASSAVQGIRIVASLLPAILFGICVCVMKFYPITSSVNEHMQEELASRRTLQNHYNQQL